MQLSGSAWFASFPRFGQKNCFPVNFFSAARILPFLLLGILKHDSARKYLLFRRLIRAAESWWERLCFAGLCFLDANLGHWWLPARKKSQRYFARRRRQRRCHIDRKQVLYYVQLCLLFAPDQLATCVQGSFLSKIGDRRLATLQRRTSRRTHYDTLGPWNQEESSQCRDMDALGVLCM